MTSRVFRLARIATVLFPHLRRHAVVNARCQPISTTFMTRYCNVMQSSPPFVATVLAAMLGASSLSQLTEMHEVRYTPTSAYCILEIEGFRIFVSPALFDDSHSEMQALGAEALRALQWQLYLVTRAVGDEPLAKLRLVPIWLELPSKASPAAGAEYHWSREWCKRMGETQIRRDLSRSLMCAACCSHSPTCPLCCCMS